MYGSPVSLCVILDLSRRETPGEPAWPDPHDRRRSAPKRVPFPRKVVPVRLGARRLRGLEARPRAPHPVILRRPERRVRARPAVVLDPKPPQRNRACTGPPERRERMVRPGPRALHPVAPRRPERRVRVRPAAAPGPRLPPRNRAHARPSVRHELPVPGNPLESLAVAERPTASSASRRFWPMPGWPVAGPARP